ncbi:MAG TPA: hypothetical protein VGK59_08895 [Ohtaekwangia sp.]
MNNPVAPKPTGPAETSQPSLSEKFPRIAKIFKLIKYFIISSIILTVMEIGFGYWLFSSRWNLLIDREKMKEYAEEVNQAPPVHPKYMEIYEKLFPNHVHTTLGQQIFINYGERIFLRVTEIEDKPHCACDLVYDIQVLTNTELKGLQWDGRLQDLEYGFGIEKFSTPEKCFDYVTNFYIAKLLGSLDPNRYPHLVNKSLDNFTDEDLIEVMIIINSVGKIDRHKTPALFNEKMNHYLAKLEKARAGDLAKK